MIIQMIVGVIQLALLVYGSLDEHLCEPGMISEEIHNCGGISQILEISKWCPFSYLGSARVVCIENKTSLLFLDIQTFAPFTKTSMGWIWEDSWGSAVLIFRSVQSKLGIPPVQATQVSDMICTRPPMMGFIGQKIAHVGEVPVALAELEPVEVMSHSSTINWVGWTHWVLGLAGEETESSS